MRAAITFLTGLMTTTVGLAIRSCGSGADAELLRYWCGPQPAAALAELHVHCARCGMVAAGFVTMIAAIVAGSLPRRRAARERA